MLPYSCAVGLMVTVLVKVVQPERSVFARADRGERPRRERRMRCVEWAILVMYL